MLKWQVDNFSKDLYMHPKTETAIKQACETIL
jgi:hypothetical protein